MGNYSIACNKFIDDQLNKSLKYGIYEESISQPNNHHYGNTFTGIVNAPEFFQGIKHQGATWSNSPINKISLEKDTVTIGIDHAISTKVLRTSGSNLSSVAYKLMVTGR